MMSNLTKYALTDLAIHHLRDGNDDLMYADGPDGNPDKAKPMRAHMFGPGSKKFAKAKAEASNRNIDRFKKKGKADQSAEDQAEETAKFLDSCTDHLENIEVDGLTGSALNMAVYTNISLCFIPAQLDKFLAETANFTKASQPT